MEATYLALLHLEAQEYARADLRAYQDIESGLIKCKAVWDTRKRHDAALRAIRYEYKTDTNGNRLSVQFEEGLTALMRYYRKDLRLSYFRDWLADDYLQQLTEEIQALGKQQDDEGLSPRKRIDAFALILMKKQKAARLQKESRKLLIKVVERKIREMRRRGIPAGVFERARLTFRDWKARKVSEGKSASGTKGAEKTNAKPKRKRAARPPFEELKKMGIDWSEEQSQ